MEDEFIAQMTGLVKAQNRTLLKLAGSVSVVATWFYLFSIGGILVGFREWNSFMISSFFSPCKLAAIANTDATVLRRAAVSFDAGFCLIVLRRQRLDWFIALHAIISIALSADLPIEGKADTRVGFALALAVIAPLALLIQEKIKSTVVQMEEGLARLVDVGDKKED